MKPTEASTPSTFSLLLVDDDPLILELLASRLEFEGYRVQTAKNGEEAYVALATMKPHLIVCDVVMPKVDGLAFCRRLRDEGNQTPFLFLTAKGQPNDIVELLAAGADNYVLKPFEAPELVARINGLLRRSSDGIW